MKTTIKIALAALMFTGLWSCTDDDNFMITQPEGSFELNTPDSGTSIILTQELATNPALTFTWDPAVYTTATEVSYELQIAKEGTNFEPYTSQGSTTALNKMLTVQELNSAALASGLEADVAGTLNVRVKASIGNGGAEETYSNTILITVTPYIAFVPLQDLFLVGEATEYGWNPNNGNAPLFRDPEELSVYYFRGYFNTGGFKILSIKGEWHPQYGSTATEGQLGVSNADGSNEPGQIMVAAAGYYDLVVNIEEMTYTLDPFDASTAPSYTTLGVIGSSTPTGWDSDTDMTQTTQNTHLWHIDGFDLVDGELKIRENNDWVNSWGNSTPLSGQGHNANDPNIPVVAGTYDIWFNDLDGRYILIPVN